MTVDTLRAQAASQYGLSLSEVTATEAPNGGTVIWHEYCNERNEDDFALCWLQTDGTVTWDEDPYGWNEVATAAGY
jgi:hypothetical protein